ncbi:MAG: site-specific DNA-methyltransferase [Phycisphaerae bacterium]|nr:site-specific DNA-methyltransferase [Phycisphaerae bacterium]
MTDPAAKKPSSHVRCGDNLPYMAQLPEACCDLIYIDPPFFTGRRRTTKKGRGAFSDRWRGGLESYLAFMSPRLEQCHRLLARHGTLYVHIDWRVAHHVRLRLDAIFGDENFLNEIVWHYRTGGVSKRWFGRKHDTILAYARKLGEHRFNVQREGAFRTDGLKNDADGRPYKSTRKGRLYFNADGPALTDVWDIPFLSTVSLERTTWPTQKPLALLERIIRASTNAGDLVADFFCGSGTTLVAAKTLNRRWLGCDISKQAVHIARRRLAARPACAGRKPTDGSTDPSRA